MAYVPGSLHDVFISYACADDRQDGLVQHFHTLLTNALAEEGLPIKAQGKPDGVDVFLDRRRLEAGSDLTEQVLTSARSTAVFIALHSPAYMTSMWCQGEAREFTANYDPVRPNLAGRLFVAALAENGSPAESEIDALRSRRFRRFYYRHKDGNDFRFDPKEPEQCNEDGYTFKEEARILAKEMARTLKAMHEEARARRVFLAETSPARAPHAEDVKRWLMQKQVIVLRASGQGADWEANSRTLIRQADLFVDMHEATPTAAGTWQSQVATELKKERVRWLPRGELSIESAQVLMSQTRVVEETLEDFKASLLGLLVPPAERHKAATPRPAEAPVDPGTGTGIGAGAAAGTGPANIEDIMVLLVGAKKDEAYFTQLERALDEIGCGRNAFVREDVKKVPDSWLEELSLKIKRDPPTGVVFVDGQCDGEWRDERFSDLLLVVSEAIPTAKRALCIFPPPEKSGRHFVPRPKHQVVMINDQQLDRLKALFGGGA